MISLPWKIKLKAANERARPTNTQKLVDTDDCAVIIGGRGTGDGEGGKGCRGQIYGDGGRFGFGRGTRNAVYR